MRRHAPPAPAPTRKQAIATRVPPAQKRRGPADPVQLATHLTALHRSHDARERPETSNAPERPGRSETGLPARLKAGVEALSGLSMDDVKVHYGSPKPAQLRALAYTQGADIHVGPGQERHLPHEAWHVVQQKQGRVKPTLQKKGVPINDAGELEREADAMGEAAARLGGDAGGSHTPRRQASGAQSVVQRMVGFEFQTNWLVLRESKPLNKFDPIGTGNHAGFKVEADEAAGGESEIEFVVHPPLEEGPAGYAALASAMAGVTTYATALVDTFQSRQAAYVAREQAAPPPSAMGGDLKLEGPTIPGVMFNGMILNAGGGPNVPFPLGFATSRRADDKYMILPQGALTAGPQATAGFDLARIGNLQVPEGANRPRPPAELENLLQGLDAEAKQVATSPAQSAATATAATTVAAAASASASSVSASALDEKTALPDSVRGLLVLIRNYLTTGAASPQSGKVSTLDQYNRALNYPKQIADVVLARTHFGKLFAMLPEGFRKTHDKARWLALVMANVPHLSPDSKVITREVKRDPDNFKQGVYVPNVPTIRQWVEAMVDAQDLLTVAAGAAGVESMGALGERTERIGGAAGPQAGIVEFRGAARVKIPLTRWGPFALEFQRYISALHNPMGAPYASHAHSTSSAGSGGASDSKHSVPTTSTAIGKTGPDAKDH